MCGQDVQCVDEFTYLGVLIHSSCSSEPEIRRQCAMTRTTMQKLDHRLWRSRITTSTKLHLYNTYNPPHHVVRIGMLDSQQSRPTSNWRAGPVVPAKNPWLQMVGFREEWRCPSCHSAASTFLYWIQDLSPLSVWPYSPNEWVDGC